MARTYEPNIASGVGFREFAAIRLKRLWPTMCVGALLGLVTHWSDLSPLSSLIAFLMAALFIPFVNNSHPQFPTNPPAWSIVLELLANALHILGLRFLGPRGLILLAMGIAPLSFGRRVLTFLGAISFPLYATHFPLAMMAGRAGYGIWVSLPLAIVCAWLVSLATNRSWLPKGRQLPLPASIGALRACENPAKPRRAGA